MRELWIVDYEGGKVFAHWFGDSAISGGTAGSGGANTPGGYLTTIYTTRDIVPMQLYNGEIKIDFADIDDYIKKMTK